MYNLLQRTACKVACLKSSYLIGLLKVVVTAPRARRSKEGDEEVGSHGNEKGLKGVDDGASG